MVVVAAVALDCDTKVVTRALEGIPMTLVMVFRSGIEFLKVWQGIETLA